MKYAKRKPLKIVFFSQGCVTDVLESSFTPSKLRFSARRFLTLKEKSRFLKAFSSFLLVALLSNCASNSNLSQWDYEGKNSVVLMDTEQFLPIQQRDETGQLVPYVAKPNPYAELSGRIDKKAVTTYIEARRAFNEERFDAADKLLSKINDEEPKLSGPWVMRGDIAMAEEKLDLAVERYAKAIEVNQVNFNAWLRLAKAQRERGLYRHAQNTYARALALWPDAPEVHLNLGVLYDVYLNQPLRAQAHMEAYQLLHTEENKEAAAWLDEVRSRTGIASTLKILGPNGELELLSNSPQSDVVVPQNHTNRQLVAADGKE